MAEISGGRMLLPLSTSSGRRARCRQHQPEKIHLPVDSVLVQDAAHMGTDGAALAPRLRAADSRTRHGGDILPNPPQAQRPELLSMGTESGTLSGIENGTLWDGALAGSVATGAGTVPEW